MTTDETRELRSMLAVAFSERPMPVADAEIRAERRRRAITSIEATLDKSLPMTRKLVGTRHWHKAAAAMALAAGLGLVLARYGDRFVGQGRSVAFSAIDSKGQILCNRDDWSNWTACDPAQTEGFVGLRTLDNAGVSVQTEAGVQIHLDAASTLYMKGANDAVRASQVTLAEGSVDVRVPKLGPDRQFSIVTPSATVTVHGTEFTVEVRKDHADKGSAQLPRTCVRLREGVVSVRAEQHEYRLVAPATWGCEPAPTAVAAKATAEAAVSVAATSGSAATSVTASMSSRSAARQVNPNTLDRSTLAAETKLLQQALQAERRKDRATAEKSLRHLLSSYPNSVVAPEARVALERITRKGGQ